ncbi:MAG: hypothetical protein KatS3mg110_0808 [Pirellulaceae bacterium]|nr:MAG: hypothetical protein KatS3mg110_0808 [Pirellulaceae bacterium]
MRRVVPFSGWAGAFGIAAACIGCFLGEGLLQAQLPVAAQRNPPGAVPYRTPEAARQRSASCIACHGDVGDMHPPGVVNLGCADCHGGNPAAFSKEEAHVQPRFPAAWKSSANPVRSYTLLNHESPEFIQFVNPGDLRVAQRACGQCHPNEVLQVQKSMMTHGCMLWGAALYNNGAVPNKWARYGESYSMHGVPQRIQTVPPPTPQQTARFGILPYLDPLPNFEISQPSNILRIFERGGRFRPEIGIPERLEEPGRPRERVSTRGLGTENRTDPVFIGLQKTRLLDPTLNFLGTNDHPGDYRSSGCTACHVVYANDRSPVHSGPYARYGNRGRAAAEPDALVRVVDPTIPKDESGHPIHHRFTRSIPTSQCIVCHIHPGTTVLNSYLGFMWWDNETDGELMYPPQQRYPTAEEYAQALLANPEEASVRGLWSDPEFLAELTQLNQQTRHTQFADFHGHGWVFRAVFKKDRQGRLLDHRGRVVSQVTNEKLRAALEPPTAEERLFGKKRDDVPVHLMDIHLEKGMHCVDCHFHQDNHGNTLLYGEVRAAIEITCVDCHGSASESVLERLDRAVAEGRPWAMPTSGPAAPPGGHNLLALRTPFGQRRFEVVVGSDGRRRLVQRSMVEPGLSWEVVQTKDTLDPTSPHYNVLSHMAKTVRWADDGRMTWGGDPRQCAHQDARLNCIACHSSWNPSCFGCHLPQKANRKVPNLHNLGDVSRNLVSYNFQTLRDDVYMLAHDGNVTGNRIGPVRSACAIHVSSYNQNRENIYIQQQTISAEGLSGIAFSTNVPHTVRGGNGLEYENGEFLPGIYETKMCTDCHVSERNDNNAILAQLFMLGTGYTNFIGRYCWVAAGEHGLEAVIVTEQDEPQAVIGSTLHQLAYPDYYRKHLERGRELEHAHEHPGRDIIEVLSRRYRHPEVLHVQARGEYLYAACGPAGLRVFDIAFIDHKGFSERIITAPVSPLGQRFYVRTQYATYVAAPSTTAPDPTRTHRPENCEPVVHPMYGYLYVADKYEGIILVGAGTLLDGNPLNNFLERAATYNPDGILSGARHIQFVGTLAYVCCDAGLVIVDFDRPTEPQIVNVVSAPALVAPRATAAQFRYAFVCDVEGVKVLDITDPRQPRPAARLELPEANSIYLARTYAYVAAGPMGLVIVDITNPEQPVIDQVFDADGQLNDARDVQLGITNVSQFAYVADGKNGLRVVQLTSAETPGNDGFSPRPTPRLIATYRMRHGAEALRVSRGVDRDRAVDESGNQLSVFGRVGARPLSLEERHRMYLKPDGQLWRVSDNPFDSRFYQFPPELARLPQFQKFVR